MDSIFNTIKAPFVSVWHEFKRVVFDDFPIPETHHKCRNSKYPRTEDKERLTVPDNKVSWDSAWDVSDDGKPDDENKPVEYKPVKYTSQSVLDGPKWADKDLTNEENKDVKVNWNKLDGNVNRKSFHGNYEVIEGLPRNPVGRTGIKGRGSLGRWGPNHAADPIVTRWKQKSGGSIEKDQSTQKPILQFVAIQRGDTGEWAIPGGMVDAGEKVSVTLKREFGEEAMNSLEATEEQKKEIKKSIDKLLSKGKCVYRGYVDDPRNTDNSWMETVAMNFHDDKGDSVGKFALHAGDDAVGVKWTDINAGLKLFASHSDFVKRVAEMHKAHWGEEKKEPVKKVETGETDKNENTSGENQGNDKKDETEKETQEETNEEAKEQKKEDTKEDTKEEED